MATKLTAAAVERLKPDPIKRLEIADAVLVGLYLVIQPTGKRSWAVRYRHGGETRKLTLGGYPAVGLAAARSRAREALEAIGAGFDPAGEKRAAKAASEAPAMPTKPVDTFARIARMFISQYAALHTKTWTETARLIDREVIPVWGDRLFTDITRADVNELLRAILDRGAPYTSNRTLAYLRKLWSWAIDEGYAESSPCDRVKKKAPEVKRDRALDDEEIRIVWSAWVRQGWAFGDLQKLLLITGQRREEVAGIRWDEIDLEDKLWSMPRDRTKSDRAHLVPLSPLALDVITTLPRFAASPYVFPAQRARRSELSAAEARAAAHVSGYSKAKAEADRLIAAAGMTIPAWRWHDLRRTVRTNLSRLRVPDHISELVIGHVPQGLAAVYDRWSYIDEKREALDAWAGLLSHILDPAADAGKVVPLKKR